MPAMGQLKTWEWRQSTRKKTAETRAERSLKAWEPEAAGWRRQDGETGTCSIIPRSRSRKPAGLRAQHRWLSVLPRTLLRNAALLTLLTTPMTRVCENTEKRIPKKKTVLRDFPAGLVQWLRLCVPDAGSLSFIPGRGTRPHILPQRLKSLHVATKTWSSKISK